MKNACWTLNRVSILIGLSICLLAPTTVGCGGGEETGTVKGTVLLGDSPFSNASVVLVSSESGQGGSAELASDGTFSIETEIPVGTYTAYFAPMIDEEEMMERMKQGMPVGTNSMENNIPQKYQNEASSDITVQVEPGENEVTLKMNPR